MDTITLEQEQQKTLFNLKNLAHQDELKEKFLEDIQKKKKLFQAKLLRSP